MGYEISLFQRLPEKCDGGFASRVAGTVNNEPFCVDVWCEYDGRDVDFEHVWGFNLGFNHELPGGPSFFDELCEHKPWIDAMNEDYKRWEKAGCPT